MHIFALFLVISKVNVVFIIKHGWFTIKIWKSNKIETIFKNF